MSVDIYTFNKLRKILSDLYNSNVGIYRIKDIPKIKTGILLRHDFDYEIESALEAAKMEFDIGIQSTFYFLVSSQFYNIFSQRGRYIVDSICDMGHEIGLHFDPSIYKNIDVNFWREIYMMEEFLGDKVYSMAVHNPFMHGMYPKFKGVIDAYDKSLFSKENYFSDSRFEFNIDIEEIIKRARKGLVQLLFHPAIYCFRDENESPNIISIYKTIIKKFGNDLLDQLIKAPSFEQEIKDHPASTVTIDVRIK